MMFTRKNIFFTFLLIVFSLNSLSKTTFSLFDILGKQLSKEVFTPQNANKEISLLGLKKGIYIANLKTEKGTISKKIIID